MSDFNNSMLMGRLVRNPEVRFTGTGTAVANFCVAANHRYQNAKQEWQDEPAFVPCVAFARAAESLAHKQKGDGLIVIGRLRTDSWQKAGAARSRLVLVAEKVQYLRPMAKSVNADQLDLPSASEKESQTIPF